MRWEYQERYETNSLKVEILGLKTKYLKLKIHWMNLTASLVSQKKIKGWRNVYHTNTKCKKVGVTFINIKIYFKAWTTARGKTEHFKMIKVKMT